MESSLHSLRILICDDDSLFRRTLDLALRKFGTITATSHSDEALQLLGKRTFDLVILDIQMRTPDEGLKAIPRILEKDQDLSILVVSGLRDFLTVREALKLGATDYIPKDFDPDELEIAVERIQKGRELRRSQQIHQFSAKTEQERHDLIGQSACILEVKRLLERFRASKANVLIQGETGTGKELAARCLRKSSSNGDPEPFVAIDSATLHTQTAESILFGHERGAFTGAEAARKGLFEEAHGGVLFFDEIANMPLTIQAKLLRVLQEKEITRMGSARVIPLDFRVICATNRDLEDQASRGEFLPDLLQRLNVLPVQLPPLRERLEDLPILTSHLLRTKGARDVSLSREAMALFEGYSWPGNVRELSALLDYSLAMVDGPLIDVSELHPKLRNHRESSANRAGGFYEQVEAFERKLLAEEYLSQKGNISQMATRLGIDRSHLHGKLVHYGIHAARAR